MSIEQNQVLHLLYAFVEGPGAQGPLLARHRIHREHAYGPMRVFPFRAVHDHRSSAGVQGR